MSNSATKRGKVISDAEFERLWSDYSLTCAQIGAWLGIARQSVSTRARRRGLPPRPQGRRVPAYDGVLFGRMVSAGVRQADIAAHFGISDTTVRAHARRAGLVPKDSAAPPITLHEFAEMELARRMAGATKRRAA